MNFVQLQKEVNDKLVVNGEYKTGKLNAKENSGLKEAIDAFEIPGFSNRSEKIYALRNNLHSMPNCACGNPLHFIGSSRLAMFCSSKCAANDMHTKQRREETVVEKYGTKHIAQAKEVRAKMLKTNQEKYGSTSAFANQKVKDKIKETNLLKYGVENVAQRKGLIREKIVTRPKVERATRKVEVSRVQDVNEVEFLLNKLFEQSDLSAQFDISEWGGVGAEHLWKHETCKHEFTGIVWDGNSQIKCPFCGDSKSRAHGIVKDLLVESGVDFEIDNKTAIAPYNLDFYIPSKKIGICVNTPQYHNVENTSVSLLQKSSMFEQSGHLIHLWDFEVLKKPQAIRNIILAKLGTCPRVGARKFEVRVVPKPEAKEFFNLNHLQGSSLSTIVYGLYDKDNKLTAAASFGRPRFSKKCDWEIIRFASCGVSIQGGFSKILNAFREGKDGEILVSFADRRISYGEVYLKTGFTLLNASGSNYFYLKGETMIPRYAAMKHKLKDVVKNFDPILSERELMLNDNWVKCEDCGNLKFELRM